MLISNFPGCVAAVTAIVNMLPLMQGRGNLKGVQTVLVGGTLSNLCLWSYLIFSGMSGQARSKILGLYASAFCVILFGSPLSTISKVLAKRDSASILGAFTFAQVVNCALWSASEAAQIRCRLASTRSARGLRDELRRLRAHLGTALRQPPRDEGFCVGLTSLI